MYNYKTQGQHQAEKDQAFILGLFLGFALGFALAACAELRIDSCPMEGANFSFIKKFFHPDPINGRQ